MLFPLNKTQKLHGTIPVQLFFCTTNFPATGKEVSLLLQNLRFFFRTHRKQLRTAGVFFLLGLAYYIVTQLTPLRIPCLFQKITGLACPGCGISHFCIRLLHLDLLGAVKENLAIALLFPLWLAAFLVRVLWNPKWFAKGSKGENLLLWGSVVVLLLFGIVRNLPHMEFLLPSYLQ